MSAKTEAQPTHLCGCIDLIREQVRSYAGGHAALWWGRTCPRRPRPNPRISAAASTSFANKSAPTLEGTRPFGGSGLAREDRGPNHASLPTSLTSFANKFAPTLDGHAALWWEWTCPRRPRPKPRISADFIDLIREQVRSHDQPDQALLFRNQPIHLPAALGLAQCVGQVRHQFAQFFFQAPGRVGDGQARAVEAGGRVQRVDV
ncbi:hypothetical protein PSFL111601_24305 [Pseudomonas floridensis]